ncbi:hypothetical protein CHLNCDRAFT_133292 [Chlorella variabilis]|uniref:ABC transporter domain-containing protein n=1 Tax=Chlorella variabilis TaxID=554065 RepID=E1Z2T4_CHLVA|nr:hypothetical protein CHLNCDRAFT_133292 [Chlorella variabilis]EFN59720.1 hypothetical protein CHLNCDRAFT_133292 [Chlorella variabilis]|eukprot:XP_005851822.1 hypothetical protein CHLNCDRAFT_133292 [Chlorella variabilis]
MGAEEQAPQAAAGLPPRQPSRHASRQASRRHGSPLGGASPCPADHADKAAIQKLRSFTLVEPDGSATVVDAKKLGRAQSRALLDAVMPDPDADNVAVLRRIQARLARVGMAPPSIEVRYQDLCVETTAAVGDKQIPTVLRAVKGVLKGLVGASGRRPLRIMDGASGVLRPGRFTLLLAPPGSGKTTLLRALSGRLREQADLSVGGTILYNGHPFSSFVPERSAAYISQVDLHYPELTVREAFEFAAECQSRSYERGVLLQLAAREEALGIVPDPELDAFMKAHAFGGSHSLAVELMLHMLGLQGCADTVVGNEMMRGISGGQKKRVTSGEALVGHAKALYADEISTGLDSNTTHTIAKSLRNICHVMNSTMLVALLQPAPETFDLFDDVMLLASGMVVGALGGGDDGGTVEMHLITQRLPVFWKQREMRFYPGWCFAVPAFVFRLPYALLDATLWSLITYWAVGFDNSWRFLIFWLFLFLTCAWATSLFQAIACVCRTDTVSSAVGSFFLLVFMATGGFIVTKGSIPPWWIAAYWSNPWAYITQALAVNEFTGASWAVPDPSDPDSGLTLGETILVFRGFGTEYYWVWIGLGAVLASIVINVVVFVLAATFMKGPKSKPVISQEAMEELDMNRAREEPHSLPASVVKDIEAGAKRSASHKALSSLASLAHAPLAVVELELAEGGAKLAGGKEMRLTAASPKGSAAVTPVLPGAGSLGPAATVESSVRSKMPFEPLSVSFKDICYDVPRPKSALKEAALDDEVGEGTLRLLRHVDGAFRPGVLSALMGASGAGKSTLLDVLAGRKTGGTISGEVRVNGFPKSQRTFARVAGYVEQEDVHLPQATVGEALAFSATLRLPSTVDKQTREDFIQEILELTELDRLRNAHIGVLGVSGFSAFDELLVLKPGGVCVYFGPLGYESNQLVDYFSSIPGVAPMPPRHNPANWMLEQTSPAFENKLGIDFGEAEMAAIVDAAHEPAPGARDLTVAELNVRGPFFQYARLFQMYNRLPDYQLVRLAVTLLVGVVFGSLAWGTGSDTSSLSGVLNIAGMLFASSLFVGFTNAMTVQSAVEVQRNVYYREHAAGMYGPLPMAIAQGNVEIPYIVGQTAVYSCIVYWMVGFAAEASKFFWFLFIFGITLSMFTAYGMMCINLTPDKGLANLLMSFFFGFWNLLCGFLIPQASIPGYWIWMYWANPLAYTLYGLIVTQLGNLWDTTVEFNGDQIPIPQLLEERFGYKYSMRWPVTMILLAFLVVFRVASILALKLLNFQNR